MILEDGEIARGHVTNDAIGIRELHILPRHIIPQQHTPLPLRQIRQLIRQLRLSRAHGEIRLPQRDDGLLWIGILHNQITCIARDPNPRSHVWHLCLP